jgi:hypothetical protein
MTRGSGIEQLGDELLGLQDAADDPVGAQTLEDLGQQVGLTAEYASIYFFQYANSSS